MNAKLNKSDVINYVGLALMGLYCFGSATVTNYFAQLHIQLPFLDFPIFIGEMLIGVCLILWLLNNFQKIKNLNILHYCVFAYFIFVIVKAFYGYVKWGPLAFRNAALFYYPIFIIFGSSFFRRKYFGKICSVLLVLFISILFIMDFYDFYFQFTLLSLGIILASSYPNRIISCLCYILLLCGTNFLAFFQTSRSLIVGNTSAFIFLLILSMVIISCRKAIKFLIIGIGVILVVVGLSQFTTEYAKTMFKFESFVARFQEVDKIIQAELPEYKRFEPEKIMLYSEEKVVSAYWMEGLKAEQLDARLKDVKIDGNFQETFEDENLITAFALGAYHKNVFDKGLSRKTPMEMHYYLSPEKRIAKSTTVATNNVIFRLLIWRDMFKELFASRNILGMDFGYPLLSPSLDIMNWGRSEWTRDGWVGVHNSYFHWIYRSGIVGVLMVIGLFGLFIRTTLAFIKYRSFAGIVLCSILVNWFMASNFLLTLELPYTAIPIWSILGLTLGHLREVKEKHAKAC